MVETGDGRPWAKPGSSSGWPFPSLAGIPRDEIEWRPGDVTGRLPYSRMPAEDRDTFVEEDTEVFTVHEAHFPELVRRCPVLTELTVHLMVDRARRFNSSDMQEEKMLSLGRLAAGLAHELNNPASAAVRGAALLVAGLAEESAAVKALARSALTDEQIEAVERVLDVLMTSPVRDVGSPLDRADREDAISDWLVRHGSSPVLAATFAETELDTAALDPLADAVSGDALQAALRWLAWIASTRGVAADVDRAAHRISELVDHVKRFTYMDRQAGPDCADVEAGLAGTLRMLAAKVTSKGAIVALEVEPDLPGVHASGDELNQVWMHLVDNALDAIDHGGHVDITARRELDRVTVRVVDDGPGIPPASIGRIFDPFFRPRSPVRGPASAWRSRGGSCTAIGARCSWSPARAGRNSASASTPLPRPAHRCRRRTPNDPETGGKRHPDQTQAPEPARACPRDLPHRILVFPSEWTIRMRRRPGRNRLLPIALGAVTLAASPLRAQDTRLQGMTGELRQLHRPDLLPLFRTGSRVAQVSSYDTTGGNNDGFSGQYSFVRREGDALVLADLKGPGVVQRIWTPTPTERMVSFYFDGEATPRLRLRFIDLFSGEVEPFRKPIVGNEVGGYYSYLPIPYARSLKIVYEGDDIRFHQIQYRTYPAGTRIESFRPALTPDEDHELAAAAAAWSAPGSRPFDVADVDSVELNFRIGPGGRGVIFRQDGGGRVVGIEIEREVASRLGAAGPARGAVGWRRRAGHPRARRRPLRLGIRQAGGAQPVRRLRRNARLHVPADAVRPLRHHRDPLAAGRARDGGRPGARLLHARAS